MGLDLCVEGRAKPGHETEWRQILERSFAEKPKKGDEDRYQDISIASYEQVGAPRVGFDAAADAWIVETRGAETPEEVAAVLKEFHGYYVLRLVSCDGLPIYTNAPVGYGPEYTDFRGSFLQDCDDVLPWALIERAWANFFPEDALSYGRALLEAAATAEADGPLPVPPPPPPPRGFFARFRHPRIETRSGAISFAEQIEIVKVAGKWFLFWGERENAVRAC